MKVWVVMSNDYPDSVFATQKGADAYCERRKNEPDNKHKYGGFYIYWRSYEFDVKDPAP